MQWPRVGAQIESGVVFVNHIAWTYAGMPTGGVKKSGYGAELGELGITEFVKQKLIPTIDCQGAPVPNGEEES